MLCYGRLIYGLSRTGWLQDESNETSGESTLRYGEVSWTGYYYRLASAFAAEKRLWMKNVSRVSRTGSDGRFDKHWRAEQAWVEADHICAQASGAMILKHTEWMIAGGMPWDCLPGMRLMGISVRRWKESAWLCVQTLIIEARYAIVTLTNLTEAFS